MTSGIGSSSGEFYSSDDEQAPLLKKMPSVLSDYIEMGVHDMTSSDSDTPHKVLKSISRSSSSEDNLDVKTLVNGVQKNIQNQPSQIKLDNQTMLSDLHEYLTLMGEYPHVDNLLNSINLMNPGDHSIICGNHVIYVSKLSNNEPMCLGMVNLANKAFAKGAFGKVYDVEMLNSNMELVFKFSRKKLKSRNEIGELIPLTKDEKLLKVEKGSSRGAIAKYDLIEEYEMMQFIKRSAEDTQGLNCHAFSIVNYKNQVGVFIKKLGVNGADYLSNDPYIRSRIIAIHQILQGLTTLHKLEIMHRDLKLENILVKNKAGSQIEAAISDFGNACHLSTLFTENRPYPKLRDILGSGTTRSTSGLIVRKIKNHLNKLGQFKFGGEDYYKITREVINLLRESDLFSFSLLAFMFLTESEPPFQSYKNDNYLGFDNHLTADERHNIIDQMRGNLYRAFKILFNEGEAIENTRQIMKYFILGLDLH